MLLNKTVVAVGWWTTGVSSLQHWWATVTRLDVSRNGVYQVSPPLLFVLFHVYKAQWYEVSRIHLDYGWTDPPPRQVRDSETVCPRVECLLVLGGTRRRPSEFFLRISQIIARQGNFWSRMESHIGQTLGKWPTWCTNSFLCIYCIFYVFMSAGWKKSSSNLQTSRPPT